MSHVTHLDTLLVHNNVFTLFVNNIEIWLMEIPRKWREMTRIASVPYILIFTIPNNEAL